MDPTQFYLLPESISNKIFFVFATFLFKLTEDRWSNWSIFNYYQANFLKNCPSLSKVPEGAGEIFNGVFVQTPGEDDLPSNFPSQPTLSCLTNDLNGQNDHIQEGLTMPEDTSSQHDNIER